MLKSKSFEVTISQMHSVILPESQVKPFLDQGHERAIVVFTFNDKSLKVHTSLKKMAGHYRASLNKGLQKQLGVFPSDYFSAQLIEDTSKYGVEMPEEFQAVLDSDPEGLAEFEALTDGKKRTIIYTILRYKNAQTRIDKSLKCIEHLKRGMRDPKLLFK